MSIVEVLIAIGIGSAAVAIASSLLIFFIRNYNASIEKLEVRKVGSGLAHNFIRVFSFSSNVITRSGTPITTNIAINQPGELRLGAWRDITSNAPGSTVAIANVRRDTGAGLALAGNRYSRLQNTGIFYVLPTATTSGVLFFDMGAQPAMSPSYNDVYFDRITELEIDRPEYVNLNGTQYLKSFHVKIGVRHFISDDKRHWRWCPQSDITAGVANCAPGVSYQDYFTDLNIVIPNQIVRTPTSLNNLTVAERILGTVYFFPFLN